MAPKPDTNVWDKLANRGFYYKTDPQKDSSRDGDILESEDVIQKRRDSNTVDKVVSAAFDTPVSISAKAGEITGKAAQTISNTVRKAEEIPYVNKIDDGLKAIDNNRTLDALSRGQLPGSDAVENFIDDPNSRLNKMKDAPWIGQTVALPATALAKSMKLVMPESWDKIVDGISIQLTRDLLTEIGEILIEWYKDPKTLCCLIKNIAAIGSTIRSGELNKKQWDMERQRLYAGITIEEIFRDNPEIGDAYYSSRNVLKKIIEYIDIIIEILSVDLSQQVGGLLDFGKEISNMITGLIVAILDAIKTKGEMELQKFIQEKFSDISQIDIQCTPFQKLMDALIRFLGSDHGLLDVLTRYILDYARYLRWQFIKNYREAYINKARDLQFLKFLRDLIQKILDSLENFELCVEDDYSIIDIPDNPLSNFQDPNEDFCPYGISAKVTEQWVKCPYRTENTNAKIVCRVSDQIPQMSRTSFCNHPNAVSDYFSPQNFNNAGKIGNISGDLSGAGKDKGKFNPNKLKNVLGRLLAGDREEIAVVFPSTNELRNFFTNKLGYSPDQADQMLAESQAASSESKTDMSNLLGAQAGTTENTDKRQELMSALGDCAKTLSPQTIADLSNKISDIL